jgi:hypothetical protein
MRKFILCVIFIFIYFKVSSQHNVLIDDTAEIILLGESTAFFEDKSRTLTFAQIKQPSFDKNFHFFPRNILNLDTASSAAWLKLNLSLKTNKKYYLQIDNPDIDSAFFYFPTQQQEYKYSLSGKSFPITSENIASTHYTVEIPKAANNEIQTYYLRLTSKRYIIVDIKAVSQNTLLKTLLRRYMLELIFFGVVFLSALYNLFVFISIRDISYLYYVIYTVLIGLNIANTRGYLSLFFPDWQLFVGNYSFLSGALRLSNFIAHKTLLILCCNGKENSKQKTS